MTHNKGGFMAGTNIHEPIISIEGKRISQIGIVVDDVLGAVVEMGRLFGLGPWTIVDVKPTELVFHDKYVGTGLCVQRIALADLAGLQIELIEPLYGPGPHKEFLEKRGQAIQHFSFGEVSDHDQMLESLKKAGVLIEFQGLLAGSCLATYMDTVDHLGTALEFLKPVPPLPEGEQGGLVPIGNYTPLGPPELNMEEKRIVRFAVVVGNAEKVAGHYQEILGIAPWTFTDKTATDVVLHGRALGNISFSMRSALAQLGDLQIELIQPLSGPSLYMEFFGLHGNGIHHLTFGYVDDADAMVSTMERQGYVIEMRGVLEGDTEFFCMSTQRKLGAIFAFDKKQSWERPSYRTSKTVTSS
jgi:hypothetical protein